MTIFIFLCNSIVNCKKRSSSHSFAKLTEFSFSFLPFYSEEQKIEKKIPMFVTKYFNDIFNIFCTSLKAPNFQRGVYGTMPPKCAPAHTYKKWKNQLATKISASCKLDRSTSIRFIHLFLPFVVFFLSMVVVGGVPKCSKKLSEYSTWY